MILNPSDPTGLGLFSKCARNQAAKLRPHRPATANRSKTTRSIDDSARKKLVTHYSFAKQESRGQRQSKYRRDETPPVGQYNPVKKQQPKLVWDILKVYHHQIAKKKNDKTGPSKQNIAKSTQSIVTPASQQAEIEEIKVQQPIQSMASLCSQPQMSAVNKSQCMVNMSRMTGRKDETIESVDWGDANVMKSVGYIKRNVTKNIYFSKQPKQPTKRYETINPASNYTYDYRILRPRKNGLLDFSTAKGRDEKPKNQRQYDYQHYEYNDYVWQSISNVFSNTKTHLVQFKKQSHRYKKDKSSPTLQS